MILCRLFPRHYFISYSKPRSVQIMSPESLHIAYFLLFLSHHLFVPIQEPLLPSHKRLLIKSKGLSRNLSVFSSLAALFEKLTKEHFSSEENLSQEVKDKPVHDENEFAKSNTPSMLIRLKSRVCSTKKNPSTVTAEEATDVSMPNKLDSTYSQVFSLKRHSSTLTEDEGNSRSIPQETVCIYVLSFKTCRFVLLSHHWMRPICF